MVHTVQKGYGWDRFATADKPEWEDILKRHEESHPRKNKLATRDLKLLELPGELLDLILGDDSLSLRDHLALAATSRSLRACYYTPDEEDPDSPSNSRSSVLWSGLLSLRPHPRNGHQVQLQSFPEEDFAVDHIWTNAPIDADDEMQVLRVLPSGLGSLTKAGKPRKRKRNVDEDELDEHEDGDAAIKSLEWNQAIQQVHYHRLTKTDAKAIYKLKGDELTKYLYAYCKKNPRARRTGHPINTFLEASVESLAFRLHGGALKHQQLVSKRLASAAKAAATRQKNGTTTGGRRGGGYHYYGCG